MTLSDNLPKTEKFVVLIVAEPGVISDHVKDALSKARDLQVLGIAKECAEGVTKLRTQHIDTIIIDIGMAQKDVIANIGRMLKIDEKAKIIMVSTLTFDNVKRSMRGFNNGAVEFVQTPAHFTKKRSRPAFESELRRTVRSLAQARRDGGVRKINRALALPSPPPRPPVLRRFVDIKPDVIAIASSTGGPQALHTVLGALAPSFDVPIFITQHMPKTFTAALAQNLAKQTKKKIVEATDGEHVEPGKIYIAPGDYHMEIDGNGPQKRIRLNQNPAVNFCRPSADPMLESIAKAYSGSVFAVILTGMGADGKNGAKDVIDAGGQVIAQDFETSTVWGMPAAVSDAGYCSKVLSLHSIGPFLNDLLRLRA